MNEKLGNRMLPIDYLKWLPEADCRQKKHQTGGSLYQPNNR
ncbi:hypothetical protein [Hydrogenovibrio marinus]|nr:hypothetical protein [Hydrogenovibrio marinus]